MKLPFIKMNKNLASEEINELQKNIGQFSHDKMWICEEYHSGMLIGINLTELAKIGLEGVNEFRWSAKLWATKIAVERQAVMAVDKINVLSYQYPAKLIESSYWTTTIIEKRHSLSVESLKIIVQFSGHHLELSGRADNFPAEIIAATLAGLKLSQSHSPADFCLKIYGREEYLVSERPLLSYTSIVEDIDNSMKTFLVMMNIDEVVDSLMKVNTHENFLNNQTLRRIDSDSSSQIPQKINQCQISSVEMKDHFIVEIGQLKLREFEAGLRDNLYLRMSVYHGNVELTSKVDTLVRDILLDQSVTQKQKKSKCVEFDISVCNIPRNGRLCFGLFVKDKKGKRRALGWANRMIFNYNGIMRQSYSMFLFQDDEPSHDVLNPYKTTEENYKSKDCTSLDVNFINTFQCTVVFPEEIPIAIEVRKVEHSEINLEALKYELPAGGHRLYFNEEEKEDTECLF